jgi:hypothetical protein
MTSFSFGGCRVLGGAALACAIAAAASFFTPSPASAALQSPVLPSFACYETAFGPSRALSVRLTDEFGKRSTAVGAAVTLCASASIDGKAAADPKLSLACHSLEQRVLTRLVPIVNVFGSGKATLTGDQQFCTPAAVATGGALGVPPGGLDSFTCYSVRPPGSAARKVAVADSFSRSDDQLGPLTSLCAPASVDDSTVVQPRLLACYQLTSVARSQPAIVRSRFGLLKASPGLRRQLCVPSTRV